MSKRKLISNILLLIGILLLLVPMARDKYNDYQTSKIIEELENQQISVDSVDGKQGKFIQSDKINLKMPIAVGTTFENMTHNVATIKYDKIYEGKNYSIAGHRYIRHGRHFNRLDELVEGDNIQIVTVEDEIINYKLVDKLVVDPSDVDVLADSGDTELTLITCHPPGISTHRLVIKAIKED